MNDDEFGDTGTDDIEDEIAWLLRPQWLHPDCRNACAALELGTCCKYPDNPLVRVAVDLAESVDRIRSAGSALRGRRRRGRLRGTGRRARPAVQRRPRPARAGARDTAQAERDRNRAAAVPGGQAGGRAGPGVRVRLPVGVPRSRGPRPAGARAGLEPLRPLLAESAHAIRAALTGSGR